MVVKQGRKKKMKRDYEKKKKSFIFILSGSVIVFSFVMRIINLLL